MMSFLVLWKINKNTIVNELGLTIKNIVFLLFRAETVDDSARLKSVYRPYSYRFTDNISNPPSDKK